VGQEVHDELHGFRCGAPACLPGRSGHGGTVQGTVRNGLMPLAGVRVTAFDDGLSTFCEVRTGGDGTFMVADLPAGTYRLGAALRGREYQQVDVAVGGGMVTRDFTLGPRPTPAGGTLEWSFTGNAECQRVHPHGAAANGRGAPPQLYNPTTGVFRATGNFTQPSRGFPDHSDHSIVVLADGRVVALGIRAGTNGYTAMSEIYNPATEQWSAGTSPALRRFQAEVVQLPDGNAGGGWRHRQLEPRRAPHPGRGEVERPVRGRSWRQLAAGGRHELVP